jgi:hypothetical protein
MSDRAQRLTRRNFLLTLGASGAATAAAVVAGSKTRQPEDAAQQARDSAGYQATSHIRNYYRTAKV